MGAEQDREEMLVQAPPTHRDMAEHHTELLPPDARLWPSQLELEEDEVRVMKTQVMMIL